uniref:sigma-54-dependent transcriptional regulator n=1 Tax=Alloprevotella sp. TaxID=1872471 RepID=UPI004029DE84
MSIPILIVEDDLTFSTMLSTWLRKKDFEVNAVSSVSAAVKALTQTDKETPQLVLSDLRLPDHDGLYLLAWMRKQGFAQPFIVMTSYAEVQNAVEAMKLGATDYISKPIQPDLLLQKMKEALRSASLSSLPTTTIQSKVENITATTSASLTSATSHPGIEGHSPIAQDLYRLVALVAPTPLSVLINGASGTGKEYVAHRIHELSKRVNGPFVAIDCGALTKELAASELFGHTKGAFTGALNNKVGAFEQAQGGTLFLDEVGNLSYDVQVQLLRALQERRIRPVGSAEERSIDIRLVCATNENMTEAITQGRFREDLFHRINEFTLHMPLLRERGRDIIEFAHYFLQQANHELGRHITHLSPDAEQALLQYAWPGNLREMRNIITRAALLTEEGNTLTSTQLLLPNPPSSITMPNSLSLKVSQSDELSRIQEALQITGGNKSRAAKLLGIDRKTLYNKLAQLEDKE